MGGQPLLNPLSSFFLGLQVTTEAMGLGGLRANFLS
jgi:hypothetical protein